MDSLAAYPRRASAGHLIPNRGAALLGLAPGRRLPEPPFREAGGISPPHPTLRWSRWALTPPFHPCLAFSGLRRSCFCGPYRVGIYPTPGITRCPALRSPDFPPALKRATTGTHPRRYYKVENSITSPLNQAQFSILIRLLKQNRILSVYRL